SILLPRKFIVSTLVFLELSIINNFIWNYLWTWSDKKESGLNSFINRFIKFQISTISVAIINYGVLIGCTEWLKIPYMYSNIAGIAIGSLLNFFTGHFWVFKKSKLTVEPEI
ncbi:MAG TPA: GtrA family protein, partial [Chitinispirillaceae bacterium]|nr:GtrA family protein [Chitinispirillaceae bacterium]